MFATLTGQTCGDACWRAIEDVCRCSCHGVNHGCLRTANGTPPARTRTVKGTRYYFIAAIGNGGMTSETFHELDKMAYTRNLADNPTNWYFFEARPLESMAAPYAVKAWPELKPWRDRGERPYIVWWPERTLHYLPDDIRPAPLTRTAVS
jgi:hypothetical protein